ncbi:MAG: Hint domain-containing protein [Pseudomonadota bacterium]
MDNSARRTHPRRVAGDSARREHAVLSGFDPVAMVMTEDGPVPFEWLAVGDKLLTRDGGYQPVIWMDRSRLTMGEIREYPEFAPVRIQRGILDADLPLRSVYVSPQQLIHVSRDPQNMSGNGVMIAADHICKPVETDDRPAAEVITYVSVMLPAHHLIHVEGTWMGSLFTADLGAELPADCPVKQALAADSMQPVAPILNRDDARQFIALRGQGAGKRRA